MKTSDFRTVLALMSSRSALLTDIAHAEDGKGGLGVTLQGRYQDDDLLDRVRPVVLRVLSDRLSDVNKELLALGVEVDG